MIRGLPATGPLERVVLAVVLVVLAPVVLLILWATMPGD